MSGRWTAARTDYLTKPFSVMELVSRVKAVLRRCQPEGDSSILRSGEAVAGYPCPHRPVRTASAST